MSRTVQIRERRRVTPKLGRRFALGARLALLAILAQAIIPVVHHVYHGYPLPVAVIAMAAEATHAGGDHQQHDPAKKHVPTSENRTPVCPVCQSTQHLTGALLPAADAMLAPSRQSRIVVTPRDSAATVERPDSPAQPRAPPLIG